MRGFEKRKSLALNSNVSLFERKNSTNKNEVDAIKEKQTSFEFRILPPLRIHVTENSLLSPIGYQPLLNSIDVLDIIRLNSRLEANQNCFEMMYTLYKDFAKKKIPPTKETFMHLFSASDLFKKEKYPAMVQRILTDMVEVFKLSPDREIFSLLLTRYSNEKLTLRIVELFELMTASRVAWTRSDVNLLIKSLKPFLIPESQRDVVEKFKSFDGDAVLSKEEITAFSDLLKVLQQEYKPFNELPPTSIPFPITFIVPELPPLTPDEIKEIEDRMELLEMESNAERKGEKPAPNQKKNEPKQQKPKAQKPKKKE